MNRFIFALGLALALSPLGPQSGQADTAPVLTFTQPGGDVLSFDMAALHALPAGSFTTTTIWTDGPQEFRGVYLADLLAHHGITEGQLTVTAINDYSVTIPVADIHPGEALLAYERNGAPMSVRDKGPLWVVYPYDSADALRTEIIYARSVWQVAKLTVAP